VAERAALFNFEAVYQKYRKFINDVSKSSFAMVDLSRQTFLKVFLDLVN